MLAEAKGDWWRANLETVNTKALKSIKPTSSGTACDPKAPFAETASWDAAYYGKHPRITESRPAAKPSPALRLLFDVFYSTAISMAGKDVRREEESTSFITASSAYFCSSSLFQQEEGSSNHRFVGVIAGVGCCSLCLRSAYGEPSHSIVSGEVGGSRQPIMRPCQWIAPGLAAAAGVAS